MGSERDSEVKPIVEPKGLPGDCGKQNSQDSLQIPSYRFSQRELV